MIQLKVKDMAEQKDNIELRSEKVRNIIGQVPSRIIRSGITTLFVVVMILLTGSYFFRYPDTLKGTTHLHSDSSSLYFATINLPYHFIGKIKSGQKVNIEMEGYPANNFGLLKGEVSQVFPTPLETNEASYFIVKVTLTNGMTSTQNKIITFYPNLKGKAKITIGEHRLLEKLLSPIVSIFKSKEQSQKNP